MNAPVVTSRHGWHMIGELDVAGMVADHARLRGLCDRLEHIADVLPEQPDAALVEQCCEDMDRMLPLHHVREERLLHGLFNGDAAGGLLPILMEQVCDRHLADRLHAEDLAQALGRAEIGEDAATAEKLGYMLRCFFDGCRRAMAFEELCLIVLAGNRLCRGARQSLLASLAANGRAAMD